MCLGKETARFSKREAGDLSEPITALIPDREQEAFEDWEEREMRSLDDPWWPLDDWEWADFVASPSPLKVPLIGALR